MTLGNFGALIHLQGAAGSAVDDTAGMAMGYCQAVIPAATVTDDDLAVAGNPGIFKKPGQAFIEAVRFVQNRNDDTEQG